MKIYGNKKYTDIIVNYYENLRRIDRENTKHKNLSVQDKVLEYAQNNPDSTGACCSSTELSIFLDDVVSCEGENIVFTPILSSGTAPFTYLWYKSGILLVGENNSTLSLNSVDVSDVAVYTVLVTDANGNSTADASLSILSEIELAALIDQSTCAGNNITIESSVTGSGPFSYIWNKDGVFFSNSESISLNNVTSADSGIYSITASGACGIAYQDAILTVNDSVVLADFADSFVCSGSNITFTASVILGTPLSYTWMKNYSTVVGSGSSYTITNAASASAGIYSVHVTGSCGNDEAFTTLTVSTAVSLSAMSSASVYTGQTASFGVTASGTGLFTYSWLFNDAVIVGETNPYLNLTDLDIDQTGTYKVLVTGSCNARTASATLTVTDPSTIGAIGINDFNQATPYPFNIWVRDDVIVNTISLEFTGFTHGFPDDIDMMLTRQHTGSFYKGMIMSDNGGSGGNALVNRNISFDNDAFALCPNNAFMSSSSYRPSDVNEGGVGLFDAFPGFTLAFTNSGSFNGFTEFIGKSSFGMWQLWIVDDHGGQVGGIQTASLRINGTSYRTIL